ncbi:MAG: class I SAM-dependent methyltransferase [Gloeotrichia echinulata CP02]|jgi:SAM-dependent methyltransferase|nr:class I SAM-dependent methyltransferase [Gloeotrichia echinulata DEX184]
MNTDWVKDYPLVESITEEALDENNSLKKMLTLIGANKRVVDFGCATGYFAQLMNQKGCTVTGVEINPEAAKIAEKYCKEVIVADLDYVSVIDILPTQEFDVAVFGDVLEHLRNPWKVLEEIKPILKEDGYVVASIPNIAHGAIRLALLQGRFEYMEFGILDNTHLRFFTRKTIEDLFESSGYLLNAVDRTKIPIFADNLLIPKNNIYEFNTETINRIQQDQNSDTLQFIVRAVPITGKGKEAVINHEYSKLLDELQLLKSQWQQSQSALQQSQAAIAAMTSSKFWKMRTIWLNLKHALGLDREG